jgi:hypothetical protein
LGSHDGEFAWYNGYVRGGGRRVSGEGVNDLGDALAGALSDVRGHDATAHKPWNSS